MILFHFLNDGHLGSFSFKAALRNAAKIRKSPRFSVDTYFMFWTHWVTWRLQFNFLKTCVWLLTALYDFTAPAMSEGPHFSQSSMRLILTQSEQL